MSIRYNIVTAADVAEGSVKLEDWFKKETAKQQVKTEKLKTETPEIQQIFGHKSPRTLASFPPAKRKPKAEGRPQQTQKAS